MRLFIAGTLGVLCVMPWLLHGIILSGYPLFPLNLGAVHVDWRVPEESVIAESTTIANWAKVYGGVVRDDWIAAWWEHSEFNANAAVPLLGELLALLITTQQRLFPPQVKRQRVPVQRAFFIPLLIALLLWFMTAPDVRFAAGVIWLLAAMLIYAATPHFSRRALRLIGVFAVFLCVTNFVPASPTKPPFGTYDVDGQAVAMPLVGDQCFDHILPCSPYITAFHLRSPGHLASGFRVLPDE